MIRLTLFILLSFSVFFCFSQNYETENCSTKDYKCVQTLKWSKDRDRSEFELNASIEMYSQLQHILDNGVHIYILSFTLLNAYNIGTIDENYSAILYFANGESLSIKHMKDKQSNNKAYLLTYSFPNFSKKLDLVSNQALEKIQFNGSGGSVTYQIKSEKKFFLKDMYSAVKNL